MTHRERDAQTDVNQGEGDPQASGQTLQMASIQPTEEVKEEASTAAIGQVFNALEQEVEADLEAAECQEDNTQGN